MAIETRISSRVFIMSSEGSSPVDGIGPSDLKIDSLEERVQSGGVKEIILALSTTMEGDTSNFYLFKS